MTNPVLHFNLTIICKTQEQINEIIKDFIKTECLFDFEYEGKNDDGVFQLHIYDVCWASNLQTIVEICETHDHHMVGEYVAEYDGLPKEEMDKIDPNMEELLSNSKVVSKTTIVPWSENVEPEPWSPAWVEQNREKLNEYYLVKRND